MIRAVNNDPNNELFFGYLNFQQNKDDQTYSIDDFFYDYRELQQCKVNTVYTAMSKQTHQRYVVKLIPRQIDRSRKNFEDSRIANFKEQYNLIHKITNSDEFIQAGLVPVYSIFSSEYQKTPVYCCVMKYYNVPELFNSIGRLNEGEIMSITRDLLKTLVVLHANNVVHRDIKPENILYLPKNNYLGSKTNCTVLIDYDMICNFQPNQSANQPLNDALSSSEIQGTSYYFSPEILARYVDQRLRIDASLLDLLPSSDLWALGITIAVISSGKWPFRDYEPDINTYRFDNRNGQLHKADSLFIRWREQWNNIRLPIQNEQFKSIVYKLLSVDPHQRGTAMTQLIAVEIAISQN
jgi:serine/threonine protein kinase